MNEAVIIRWPDHLDDLDAKEIISHGSEKMVIKGVQYGSEGPWAAYEWIVPTTFAVTVTGLFFKSFLEEAGKDAYQIVKVLLKEYITKRWEIKTRMVAATASPNKLSKSYDQSFSISLKARLHTRILVNVMISEKVENEEMGDMLEGMFHVLELLYKDCQQQMNEETIDTNIRPEEVYLIANLEKREWDILTPKQMSEKYKS
jgi:hypothetical protein